MGEPERADQTVDQSASPAAGDARGEEEAKRLAARRRFLRLGASSSAVLVTIVHKRAFANTVKKGTLLSACVSMHGVPDIKNINSKKALQFSAMGGVKGLQCAQQPAINSCTNPGGHDQYITQSGQTVDYNYFTDKQLKNGCGTLGTDFTPVNGLVNACDGTVSCSYNNRLQFHHYCPVVFDSAGNLIYDTSAVWYSKSGATVVANACQM